MPANFNARRSAIVPKAEEFIYESHTDSTAGEPPACSRGAGARIHRKKIESNAVVLFWAVDYAILFTDSMNLSERHLLARRSPISGLSNLESLSTQILNVDADTDALLTRLSFCH
ncbi:MAG TPA: hypothetical protein VIW80_04810 [Pyrinomonadaceae bacterium]